MEEMGNDLPAEHDLPEPEDDLDIDGKEDGTESLEKLREEEEEEMKDEDEDDMVVDDEDGMDS